jgi:hypothetical protein
LIDIITEVFEDGITTTFHMMSFHHMWKVLKEQSIEVFLEAYASPAMMEAYIEVNSLPHEPDDNLKCVIASLMMYSDLTHLLNFGDASLWPFYLFLSNESKYTCGKPTACTCHHIAYIPSVSLFQITQIIYPYLLQNQIPDNFQDLYFGIFEDASLSEVHTHYKWELMQAMWKLLLDEDFMHAYEHGIVICCGDGITHQIFPHFFSYSADYPEK